MKAAGLIFGVAIAMLGALGTMILEQRGQHQVQEAVSEHPYGLLVFYLWAGTAGMTIVAAACAAVLATFSRDRAAGWLLDPGSAPRPLRMAQAALLQGQICAAVAAQAGLCTFIVVAAWVTRLDTWYEALVACFFAVAPGLWLFRAWQTVRTHATSEMESTARHGAI